MLHSTCRELKWHFEDALVIVLWVVVPVSVAVRRGQGKRVIQAHPIRLIHCYCRLENVICRDFPWKQGLVIVCLNATGVTPVHGALAMDAVRLIAQEAFAMALNAQARVHMGCEVVLVVWVRASVPQQCLEARFRVCHWVYSHGYAHFMRQLIVTTTISVSAVVLLRTPDDFYCVSRVVSIARWAVPLVHLLRRVHSSVEPMRAISPAGPAVRPIQSMSGVVSEACPNLYRVVCQVRVIDHVRPTRIGGGLSWLHEEHWARAEWLGLVWSPDAPRIKRGCARVLRRHTPLLAEHV